MKVTKTERFADLETFTCVFQPPIPQLRGDGFPLKGAWKRDFFRNDHPITLEMGCGQADYTLTLAGRFPDRNFIGLDLKGSRLWLGAKAALEQGLLNAGFIRCPGDFLTSLFGPEEVSEIILSFPDPFPDRPRKTFVSGLYLKRFAGVLHRHGVVHLKTDNDLVFQTALEQIPGVAGVILARVDDIREIPLETGGTMDVRSRYETKFRGQNKPIRYLAFRFAPPSGPEGKALKKGL